MDPHGSNDNKPTVKVIDPIQHLPPEISICIIQAALPQDGTYPAHLIDFTNVSRSWRNLLFSTPILWSQLYLDETIPDLLALLAVSIKHSGQTPLMLTILGRPIHNWTGLSPLVRPVYHRVVHLAITRTPEFMPFLKRIDDSFSTLSTLFELLGHPPNLSQLIFDERMTPSLSRFDSFKLPATVQLVGKFNLERPVFSGSEDVGRLFKSAKYRSFGTEQRAHRHLFPLALTYDPYTNMITELTTRAKVLLGDNSAHYLEKCSCFEQLIFINSSNLASLALSVDLIDLRDLFDCLRLLPKLQVLYLGIYLDNWSPPPKITSSLAAYAALKTLEINVVTEKIDHDLLGLLFQALSHLYPRLEKFSLKALSWPLYIPTYLERLPSLTSLRLELEKSRPINRASYLSLPSLQALRIDGTSPRRFLNAPSLHELTVGDEFDATRLANLNALHLHKLVVYFEREFDADSVESKQYIISFDPRICPDLVELHLVLYGSLPRLRVSSFSQLVVVKLHSPQRFTNPIGNHLCLHFIYHPEHCPLLQELHSDRCLEWDLLFLMLERRNYGLAGVKKIHAVTFPWVPFTVRSYLARLLVGKPIDQPLPTSLSLEATREAIFDLGIPGCYSCLRNERPRCSAQIIGNDELWSSNEIYPKLDISPNGVPPEVHRRLAQHEVSVRKWKDSYKAYTFGREEACDRW